MINRCPICDKISDEIVTERINNENKGELKINVWRCRDCMLDFLETWDDKDYINSLYKGDKYIFSSNVVKTTNIPLKYDEYKERLKQIEPYLAKDASLLEVGCGSGEFLNLVRDKVETAEGVEITPSQVQKVRSDGFRCYDVMITEMNPPKQYDVICMFALLEHVPNVKEFIGYLKRYLKDSGLVFIEVPNLNCPLWSCYDIPEYRKMQYRSVHQYYFTPTAIGKLLKNAGFDYEITTCQQASITNHFHWMHQRNPQPTKNHMSSVVLPLTYYNGGYLDGSVMKEVLEEVDDLYREKIVERDMGNLISARAWIKSD